VEIGDDAVIACSSCRVYKWSINPFTNPNPFYSHTLNRDSNYNKKKLTSPLLQIKIAKKENCHFDFILKEIRHVLVTEHGVWIVRWIDPILVNPKYKLLEHPR
jgi:hypothetical protein